MASKAASAVGKTVAIRTEMKEEVVERSVEIDLLLCSIIARVHMLMLGEPGVAKSMVVDQFLTHIDGATLFSMLLNKQTPPDALVGPISFQAMKEDSFRRVTTSRLPEANLAFIDEIFKSNAVNLNLMLKILNERMFENAIPVGTEPFIVTHPDGSTSEEQRVIYQNGMVKVPLWSMVAASNELPGHDKEELMAFADRIGVRKIVAPVKTEEGVNQIIEGQLTRFMGGTVASGHTMLDTAEVESLQAACTQITVPTRVREKIVELRANAEKEGLHFSARRMFEGIKLCMANALLAGRKEVQVEDLRLFEHILWNDPEECAIASELTMDFAGTVGKQVARHKASHEEFEKRLSDAQAKMPADDSEPDADVVKELTIIASQLTQLSKRVTSDIAEGTDEGHDVSDLESINAAIDLSRRSVRKTLGMDF